MSAHNMQLLHMISQPLWREVEESMSANSIGSETCKSEDDDNDLYHSESEDESDEGSTLVKQ
jgi:hypothetical protein